jgi:hypothetical protein
VPTEEKIRAFLLGMADAETEQTIEEGILDGTVASDDLQAIEEELIDEHVFGRLSPDEERSFHASFLVNPERRDKLSFSRAIQRYTMERAQAVREKRPFPGGFSRLILAASLSVSGLAAIAVVWLEIRDARMSREMAVVSRTSDERQRLLASLAEEQRQRVSGAENAAKASSGAPSTPAAIPAVEPGVQLRPGVRRDVEAIPVLQVPSQAGAVRITLQVAFKPEGGLREELLRGGSERVWTQELSSAAQAVADGITTIYLPARLLSPGDYQIRLKDLASDPSDEGDLYAFRVSRR